MVFDGADRHAQDAEQSHGGAQVGLAASTCSGRLKAMRERGIITGFHADIGLEALGVYVFGMISVRMTPVGRPKDRLDHHRAWVPDICLGSATSSECSSRVGQ